MALAIDYPHQIIASVDLREPKLDKHAKGALQDHMIFHVPGRCKSCQIRQKPVPGKAEKTCYGHIWVVVRTMRIGGASSSCWRALNLGTDQRACE